MGFRSATPIEELAIPYDPSQVVARVARRRRLLISRIISFVITVAVVVGLYLWQRDEAAGRALPVISAVVVGIALAWLLGCLVAWLRARRELASLGSGLAVRIGRAGVEVAGSFAPWSEVESLAAVRSKWGRGPRLQLRQVGGVTTAVPFEQIEVRPATLDTTARAYSAGRHGVDLSALDA